MGVRRQRVSIGRRRRRGLSSCSCMQHILALALLVVIAITSFARRHHRPSPLLAVAAAHLFATATASLPNLRTGPERRCEDRERRRGEIGRMSASASPSPSTSSYSLSSSSSSPSSSDADPPPAAPPLNDGARRGVEERSAMLSTNDDDEGNEEKKEHRRRVKIVVVGAGFAGLSVAYNLLLRNEDARNSNDDEGSPFFDVVILEARDRVGGRVWPYSGLDDGADDGDSSPPRREVTVDLGGQWVHEASRRNPIRKLMRELGVPIHRRRPKPAEEEGGRRRRTDILFDEDGSPMDDEDYRSAQRAVKRAMSSFDTEDGDEHTSILDVLQSNGLKPLSSSSSIPLEVHGDKDAPASPSTVATTTTTAFDRALAYVINHKECYEGGRVHELSPSLEEEVYRSFGGDDEVVEGGYGTLLTALVDRITEMSDGAGKMLLRLRSIVSSIEYGADGEGGNGLGGGVRVFLDDGECVVGDACVVTVSLGVLQHRRLTFVPDLTPDRWEAIDACGMGCLDKVALRFPRNFWLPAGLESFGVCHSDPSRIKMFYDQSEYVAGGEPVLLMFHGGDAARRVDSDDAGALTDEECVSEAVRTLRGIFERDGGGGEVVPDPVSSKVTRWNVDPFALGAYSFARVGCTEEMMDLIWMPLDGGGGGVGKDPVLMFAGEATCKRSYGCVHGAWLSGEREADRIIRHFG